MFLATLKTVPGYDSLMPEQARLLRRMAQNVDTAAAAYEMALVQAEELIAARLSDLRAGRNNHLVASDLHRLPQLQQVLVSAEATFHETMDTLLPDVAVAFKIGGDK